MTPPRRETPCPTELKLELVLRMLGGAGVASLSRETGRPRRQLSAWRRRFLAGGEAFLESRPGPAEIEGLRDARDELAEKVTALEDERDLIARRVAYLEARSRRRFSHPYCSEAYARALEEPDSYPLAVPDWGTHVLVREGPAGKQLAVGARPFAALDPGCDLQAGLDHLRDAGVTSVSLVTDPLWGPEAPNLKDAFDVCHKFKEIYLVDRESDAATIGKRHRNRINRARGGAELREVSLAEHLDSWLELYRHNVANRQIPQPFSESYFERLAEFQELRTFAVLVGGEIVTITTWIPYQDTLYFHDAASSPLGHAVSASYVAFAHVVENLDECRYIFLGGSADFYDDPLDGLARFKRGFANRSNLSYLCSAILSPATRAVAAEEV